MKAKRLRNSELYSRIFIAKDQSKEEREKEKNLRQTRTKRAQRNRRRMVHNKERENSKRE